MGYAVPASLLFKPVLWDAAGITAENVASEYHVPREEMDKLAFSSHAKAAAAQAAGKFKEEIVPVETIRVDPATGKRLAQALCMVHSVSVGSSRTWRCGCTTGCIAPLGSVAEGPK